MRPGVVRVGTRGSDLALRQTRMVLRRWRQVHPDLTCEATIVRTRGDRDRHTTWRGDQPGLFTSDLTEALIEGRIDLAVHSLKDLPVTPPPGTHLAAVVDRADPRDALVARSGLTWHALPAGARIGTSSVRRQALVRRLRPDLAAALIRGNVPSRIRAVEEGTFDAVVLALAGLQRLEYTHVVTEIMPPGPWPPAPGQGAVAIEARDGDPAADAAAHLDVPAHRLATLAERVLFQTLDAGCRAPVGGLAHWEPDGRLTLCGTVLGSRSRAALTEQATSAVNTAEEAAVLGRQVAGTLMTRGAMALLAESREATRHE